VTAIGAVAPTGSAQTVSMRSLSGNALTRADAIRLARDAGTWRGVARADTSAAAAHLVTAGAWANPTVSASYTKSTPQYHMTLDLPVDYPWVRGTRIRSARSALQASRFRYAAEAVRAELNADTLYTRALAAREHVRLSAHDAAAADSLRRMTVARRDAGDASDLDVELATINAGQQANTAAADSLAYTLAIIDLQTAIGGASSTADIEPTDSLVIDPDADAPADTTPTSLLVRAAEASFESARLAATAEHHNLFGAPSITAGFEAHDPSGAERGLLPTVGIAFPLPLFNRNRGPEGEAIAERERARAELLQAQIEQRADVDRASRARTNALAKVTRDRQLVASATRVSALSLRAYQEGESSLSAVLEAQRSAREILAQYVDDVATAAIAVSARRALTRTLDSVLHP